jgi:predicted kinase
MVGDAVYDRIVESIEQRLRSGPPVIMHPTQIRRLRREAETV